MPTLTVQLHQKQKEVAQDQHRFKVICAGRRFGKSVLARMICLKWATEKVGTYWIVSPNYKQSKMIHWRSLSNEIPQAWVLKKNEVELSITLKNGSIIELKGAENPDSLRGIKLRGLVIDEIASIRNWNWLWHEVLRPTLTDYIAPAIFISTPKGYNHFYDLFNTQDDDYRSWRFTSYDNPHVPPSEIDQAKQELTDDVFMQEYMADFRIFTGLVHKEWDREIHLIPPFDVPTEWARGRGFDYGSSDPTASVRFAIDTDNNWYLERCYKNKTQPIEEHARAIKAQDYGMGFVPAWGDPSGAQWFMEFSRHGLSIQPARKEVGQGFKSWVEYGVEMINQQMKRVPGHTVILPNRHRIEDAPRFFVLDTPENQSFVREVELLRWKETSDGQILPQLDEYIDTEGHSDLLASTRYFAVSWRAGRGTIQQQLDELPRENYFNDEGFY